jgi:acyl-CoA dehydrogenase
MTPHTSPKGSHLTHRETALVFRAAGLSPLGLVAVNVAAPDEGNMFLLSRVASAAQQELFLKPLVEGRCRSAFFMTEPADMNGAGSDPSMLRTVAREDREYWVINGRKAFITGAVGARIGIVMARSDAGANPSIRIERVLDTIDRSLAGGHAVVTLDNLRIHRSQMLGQSGEGFKYAQVRLAPARLTHCMRWLGACTRAHEIACDYAVRRHGFGRPIIEHEGVGFPLADNRIDLKQVELMIDWCAGVLDSGAQGTAESSMTKVAVSEALYRIADRCVQVMGGTGVSGDTIVQTVFREIRAFRIYDGPTEVHKWSLAKLIQKETLRAKPL